MAIKTEMSLSKVLSKKKEKAAVIPTVAFSIVVLDIGGLRGCGKLRCALGDQGRR